jgi:hypothetical protein
VSAKTDRAVNKETSALRSEELQCLFQQHGAMGRAYAPQRRSHLHRPVISFKELFVCHFPFVIWHSPFVSHVSIQNDKLQMEMEMPDGK